MQDLLQGNKPVWSHLNALSLNCDSVISSTIENINIKSASILIVLNGTITPPAIAANIRTIEISLTNGNTFNEVSNLNNRFQLLIDTTSGYQYISGFRVGYIYKIKYLVNTLIEFIAGAQVNFKLSFCESVANIGVVIKNLSNSANLSISADNTDKNITLLSYYIPTIEDSVLVLNSNEVDALNLLLLYFTGATARATTVSILVEEYKL